MNGLSLSAELRSFIANLTTEPGVYRMLDASSTVLYVGKASNLKQRVGSYFTNAKQGVRTRALIEKIVSIEVSVTRSETEALLLESSLIKSLQPRYNVLLRDDKSYPYIYVNRHHPFPRMEILRVKKKSLKGDYFGPYPSVLAVRETLSIIQKIFKIRNCSDNYFNGRLRPCLQYQIKRCSAPCTAYISEQEYGQSIKNATRFLQGKGEIILDELGQAMEQAVFAHAFEEAAHIRDQIKSLRLVQEQQGIVQVRGDADAIALEARPGFACIQWVTVRNGEMIASQSFFPTVPKDSFDDYEAESLRQQVFAAFLAHFYLEVPSRIPPLILTNHRVADLSALQALLSKVGDKPCIIQERPRGGKARWLDFARNNLHLAIASYDASTSMMKNRYEALCNFLKLPVMEVRMECFDISHTQGEATVASCVVFDSSGPCKSQYRRFNISGITPGDDYAAIEQAISRRYKRALAGVVPHILIIDGGKGQVSAAQRALAILGIKDVKLLGIAKGPHRKAGYEQLIVADEAQIMTLPPASPALHLLQHIRDEAHRFAITLHRNKRRKISLTSSLEAIEGVGIKRRQALLRWFGGMRELAKAPYDEIAKVKGISASLAKRIYEHLREG